MPTFPDCSPWAPARLIAAILALGIAASVTCHAQQPAAPAAGATPPAASPAPAASPVPAAGTKAADPVLATVDGAPIHMSDLNAAAETLPPQARSMPPQQLYPMLLQQLVDFARDSSGGAEEWAEQGPGRAEADAGRR